MAAGNSNRPRIDAQTRIATSPESDRTPFAHARATPGSDYSNPLGADQEAAMEARNLRRLQVMMQLLLATIQQDKSLSVDNAAQLIANTRNAALRMFPGKDQVFQMLCRPRIQRAMRERFNIQ